MQLFGIRLSKKEIQIPVYQKGYDDKLLMLLLIREFYKWHFICQWFEKDNNDIYLLNSKIFTYDINKKVLLLKIC